MFVHLESLVLIPFVTMSFSSEGVIEMPSGYRLDDKWISSPRKGRDLVSLQIKYLSVDRSCTFK
tara:strand:- start:403 stop:594 length:192 start_codon:yes stop_codon:yes gene_type:complete